MTFCLSPGGQTFLTHRRGGTNISHTQGVTIIFCIEEGQTFLHWGWGLTFFVGGGGGYDDVDEDMNVSKANFFVSEANIFVNF